MSDWAAGPAPTPWDLPLPVTRAFTPAAGDIETALGMRLGESEEVRCA